MSSNLLDFTTFPCDAGADDAVTEAGFAPFVAAHRPSPSMRSLVRVLDIVDYGFVLVTDDERLVYANRSARVELAQSHPLTVDGGRLGVRDAANLPALRKALAAATRSGLQSLIVLGGGEEVRICVSVIPMTVVGDPAAVLLILGRRQASVSLSQDAFARRHQLTATEVRVLKDLCRGVKPGSIARSLEVQLCTVRTHISNIRTKTGARDIGHLVSLVHRLPPLPCLTH